MIPIDSSARGGFMNDSASVVDCIQEREKRERRMNAQYW